MVNGSGGGTIYVLSGHTIYVYVWIIKCIHGMVQEKEMTDCVDT